MRHLETENARVIEAAGALRRGDGAALGPILSAGHASLRDDLEVSTPQLDLLVALALEHGAWGARMTGGGFGGAIVAVAPVGITDQLGADVAAAYLGRTGIPAVPLRYNSDWMIELATGVQHYLLRGAADAGALVHRAHPARVLRDRVPRPGALRRVAATCAPATRSTARSPSAGRG